MTTWGKLEEIDTVDVANLNSWQVSGSSLDHRAFVSIDDEGSFTESESGILHLSDTSSSSLGLPDSSEVIHGTKIFEVTEESTGGASIKIIHNKWKFWNRVNSVATSLD